MPLKRREEYVHITHHFDECFVDLMKDFFRSFNHKLSRLTEKVDSMVTKAEFVTSVQELKAQAVKAKAEIVAKFAALEEIIRNQGDSVPEEVVDAFNELKGPVQELDDMHPDEVVPPTE